MIHLVKLVVGLSSIEELIARQAQPQNTRQYTGFDMPLPVVHTRSCPRQKEALLKGGSLYRVISGMIVCRQELKAIEKEIRSDGSEGTVLFLSPVLIRVEARPMRPFQGWRYLSAADAPADEEPVASDFSQSLLCDLSRLGL
ncbi:MAG: DUF1489 family protein [Acetobacter sp.]|nr:DUF1489 family protein [Acetobacter sp.]MBR2123599.1 DUF1489 family protein [Acetobacter sp.]